MKYLFNRKSKKYDIYYKDSRYLILKDNDNFYFRYNIPKIEFKKYKPFRVLYSILLIPIIASFLMIQVNNNHSNYNNIYNEYHKVIKPDAFRSVYVYSYGISELEKKLKVDENDFVSHFYLANAYQNEKKFRKAIKHYKKVLIHNDNMFIYESNWQLALCYLKINETQKSIIELKKLEYNDYYADNAKYIINKIK